MHKIGEALACFLSSLVLLLRGAASGLGTASRPREADAELQAHKHAVPLKVAAVALLVARACEDPALWTCTCCDIAGELLPVVDFVARSRGAWASLKVWAQRPDATPRSARDAGRHTEVPEWLQGVPELHGRKGAMDVDVEAAGVGTTMVETAALALKVGDQVEGLYSNGDWYRARIVSMVDLGKKKKQKRNMDRLGKRMGYELAWDDGDTSETIKPASNVRRIDADVGADAGVGACEGCDAGQDVRRTEKQRARQIQTDWCGDEGWGLQETLKDRALEWYLSALTALDPRAQRAAHVTTCAHVARLFADRAGRTCPLATSGRGDKSRCEARELRWQLGNLGEALWYYKRAVAAACEADDLGGDTVFGESALESLVPSSLVGTSYNNMACVRIRLLALIFDGCKKGGEQTAPAGVKAKLRKWRRGWSWRGGGEGIDGWEISEAISDEDSGGVSAVSDGDEGGGRERPQAWEAGASDVLTYCARDSWEVLEAQRAARLFEAAVACFRQAKCTIEKDHAARNRDFALSLAAHLDPAPQIGPGADAEEAGAALGEMWMAAAQELPLPHVMACFDESLLAAEMDSGPVLLPLQGPNASISFEQEAAMRHGSGTLTHVRRGAHVYADIGAAHDGGAANQLLGSARRQEAVLHSISSQETLRMCLMRDAWRLNRLRRMACVEDADARFWALRQLDGILVALQVTLCDNEYRRQRHEACARILCQDRRVPRVAIREVQQRDYSTLKRIVCAAVARIKDEERFVTGAALRIVQHAVEYGDAQLTRAVRRHLRRLFSGEEHHEGELDTASSADGEEGGERADGGPAVAVDAGDVEGEEEEEELERTGMDRLLDFDPKMMEASKKKGGIVRVLEQELADQENAAEAARQLTERKNVLSSEVLTEAAKLQLMQQPHKIPTNEELTAEARAIKAENALFGVRRIWYAVKKRRPDWTVPEGRVHKIMAAMRAEQREKMLEAGVVQEGAGASGVGGAVGMAGGAHALDSDESDADYDSKEEVYSVFGDRLFIHHANATIQLNETEVPNRAHIMSRYAELLYRRKLVAEERGLHSEDVSMSEISAIDREEEQARVRAAMDEADAERDRERDELQRAQAAAGRDLAVLAREEEEEEDDSAESVEANW